MMPENPRLTLARRLIALPPVKRGAVLEALAGLRTAQPPDVRIILVGLDGGRTTFRHDPAHGLVALEAGAPCTAEAR